MLWFVRTKVLINLRIKDARAVWVHIRNAAIALDRVLSGEFAASDFQPGDEAAEPSLKSVEIACTAMVLHHSVDGLARLFEAQCMSVDKDRTSSLLPLLALNSDTALLDSFMSANPSIDINATSTLFGTALYAAAAVDSRSTMQYLLNHGANINQTGGKWHTSLQAACWHHGTPKGIQLLLDAGAHVNAQGGKWNKTPLLAAATSVRPDLVQLLLDWPGIDVSAVDSDRYPLLHRLCMRGDGASVRKLLKEHNVDVDGEAGMQCATALQEAMLSGDDDVVRILLEKGSDVREGRYCGGNAVNLAVTMRISAMFNDEEVPDAVQCVFDHASKRGYLGSPRGRT